MQWPSVKAAQHKEASRRTRNLKVRERIAVVDALHVRQGANIQIPRAQRQLVRPPSTYTAFAHHWGPPAACISLMFILSGTALVPRGTGAPVMG